MTWIADLSPCTYFDREDHILSEGNQLLAVGWLSGRHAHAIGPIHPDVRKTLGDMIACPWSPIQFLGSHFCELCAGDAGYSIEFLEARRRHGDRWARGHRNLFIPARDVVYVAPELVIHYIDDHRYAPPEEFCDAVQASPPMWSDAYFEALRRNGSPTLNKLVPPRVPPPDDTPLPLGPVRMLKGLALAFDAIASAARRHEYDHEVALALLGAVPKIVQAGIEITAVHWLDEFAVLIVRSRDPRRDPVQICENAFEPRARDAENECELPGAPLMSRLTNAPLIAFVPWRADPRQDVERRLAPARIDYIGLDPLSGEAKAFLLDDRPPTDYLMRHPHIGVRSRSYGDWVVDIITRTPTP